MELFEQPCVDQSGYQVLSRRFRPQTFAQVIGQDLFVKMIRNALKQGRLGHGLILSGIRGIGKTTLARLIAKALLCQKSIDGEPCNLCSPCTAVLQDRHVDVVEMDAASHTGVDDIRSLIEASGYRAVMGQYKVYIIDEVHMLSKNAFNALLKTLEEPPPHVKFILATTEIAKVPDTILSRCQKMNLAPLGIGALCDLMRQVCLAEKVNFEESALDLIARRAKGAARDALSMLEQAILLLDSSLRDLGYDSVCQMLGLLHRNQTQRLIDLLIQGDGQECLILMRELWKEGCDPLILIEDLMTLIHEQATSGTVDESKTERFSALWQMACQGYQQVKDSPMPLISFEMLLLRMAYLSLLPPMHKLWGHLRDDQVQIAQDVSGDDQVQIAQDVSGDKKKL